MGKRTRHLGFTATEVESIGRAAYVRVLLFLFAEGCLEPLTNTLH